MKSRILVLDCTKLEVSVPGRQQPTTEQWLCSRQNVKYFIFLEPQQRRSKYDVLGILVSLFLMS